MPLGGLNVLLLLEISLALPSNDIGPWIEHFLQLDLLFLHTGSRIVGAIEMATSTVATTLTPIHRQHVQVQACDLTFLLAQHQITN